MTLAKRNIGTDGEALLLSPKIDAGESCFSFWYFLKGSENATFRVATLKPSDSTWEEKGNASAYWTMGTLDIAQSDKYQVGFAIIIIISLVAIGNFPV